MSPATLGELVAEIQGTTTLSVATERPIEERDAGAGPVVEIVARSAEAILALGAIARGVVAFVKRRAHRPPPPGSHIATIFGQDGEILRRVEMPEDDQ
jgi:hypothetical protein